MTPLVVIAFGLLAAGVTATALPRVPGTALSLAGVYAYWYHTGFVEPTAVTVGLLTLVGVVALVGHLFGTFVADRVGGSTTVATIAGAVGFTGFVFLGTSGLLGGTVVTAFLLEYVRRRSLKGGFVAAMTVVLGTFASKLMQLLLSGAMLAVMVLVVFV